MTAGPLTVREWQHAATQRLEAEPELCDRAALDAGLLLRSVLRLTPAQLRAYPERALTTAEQQQLEAALLRRLAHEPVQYILGEQEFYGLALKVTPAVLIPRPETELLVEAVVGEFSTATGPLRIVDIGTGSGAIAIALAAHLPHAHLTAIDLSPAALAVARENAARHKLSGRIRFLQSDLLAGLPANEPLFDAIVSNPPYVPDSDRATLHAEVREHEPASALFAGATGLDIYRRLIPQARAHLCAGGLLALEFGFNQQQALAELLAGWHDVRFLNDLQGIPRTALARS